MDTTCLLYTSNSYEGLCEYFGGKYISYTEERPITMNPFRINREEMNVEKTGFLKNLVLEGTEKPGPAIGAEADECGKTEHTKAIHMKSRQVC